MAMQMGTTQSHRCGAATTDVSDKVDKNSPMDSRREVGRQEDSTEQCVSVSIHQVPGTGTSSQLLVTEE